MLIAEVVYVEVIAFLFKKEFQKSSFFVFVRKRIFSELSDVLTKNCGVNVIPRNRLFLEV